MPTVGKSIKYAQSSTVTEQFFGTVVKSGENPDGIKTGGSTNYGRELVGNTATTQALELLNLGSIRYPGGTEAQLFDITNAADVAGLKRAIDYCAANGLTLNFTLNDGIYINPTTQIASMTSLQRSQLDSFLKNDLIGYANSKGVTIESIHIGNEFQGRVEWYGEPAWKGYGAVSALLINEIDAVLDQISIPTSLDRPQIVIQPPNWVNDSQQATFFNYLKNTVGLDGQTAASKLDAIDLHGAGTGGATTTNTLELSWGAYFGTSSSVNYEANLSNVMAYWKQDAAMQNVEFRNDAWAYTSSPMLQDAALGMLQLHTASKLGLISVTNYVGYNSDASALIGSQGGQIALRAGGALFSMMSDVLQGTTAIGLSSTPSLQVEASATEMVRAFAGGNHVVLYDVSRTSADLAVDLDALALISSLETFVGGVKSVAVDILGSSDPTNMNGTVTHEYLSLTAPSLAAGSVDFTLNAYEIAQINIIANGVFGDLLNNTLTGTNAADVLHGLEGNDLLNGGNGNDILVGGTGADQLFGGAGNDLLFGGAGGDILNGGSEIDTASYRFASAGVSVNLASAAANTGDAASDVYSSIENVIGSDFNDQLKGDAGANLLDGGDGNDIFHFSGGADTFVGGLGVADSIQIDSVASKISLDDGTNTRGVSFSGIENILGGTGADSLTGNATSNYLAGGDGADTLSGLGGDDILRGNVGNDAVYGGAGNDQLAGGSGQDIFLGGTGNDSFIYYFSSEGGDAINDFSAVQGNDDVFNFNASGFGNLAKGRLSDSNFYSSATSNIGLDSNDLFVFRQSDKTLWFDKDGNGGAAAVLMVDLQNSAANLTVNDIWLI